MAVRTVLGRHRSERTEEEELRILQDELDNLTEDETEALAIILQEMQTRSRLGVVKDRLLPDGTVVKDGGRPYFDLMQEAEYERRMVPIREWLNDPYYMGHVEFAWPKWKEDLIELFERGYHESVLTGAIGIGKSTFVAMTLARLIYEYSCLRNPQRTYGLMSGDSIYVVVLNLNLDLARKVVYSKLTMVLEKSPYFQSEFQNETLRDIIRFPKGLSVIPRSTADTSTLGLNVIGGVLSETNFTEGGHWSTRNSANAAIASYARHGISSDVGHVYSELVTRWRSRFGRVGKLPGMFLIDSSKRDQSDFTESHLVEVKDDPFVFVRDYAIWDVQPTDRFSKKRFRVFVGDERVRSRILGEFERVTPAPGTTQQIIEVPENWRMQFERDLDSAIRNVAGIATQSIDRLFGSMEPIAIANEKWRSRFRSPFASDVWVADRPLEANWENTSVLKDGVWRLLADPKSDNAMHFDFAVTKDRYGMACGYVAGETFVERNVGGQLITEKAPIIAIRWLMAIEAAEDREIELGIGRAVMWSAMNHGHRMRWGSCDQYQSREMLQKMRAKGIEEDQLSVEGEEAYLMLRAAAQEGRLLLPDSPILWDELKYLVYDKIRGRVDHLPSKSKDLADAVCGVVYRLTLLFLEGYATPPAARPVIGVSELYESEDLEEQFWVLDQEQGRPIMKDGRANATEVKGGIGAATEPQRRAPYIVR